MNIRRFTVTQRVFHALLALSFMVQSVTGFARMYGEGGWGARLLGLFGGPDGALAVHKAGGLFMVALLLAHVVHVLATSPRGLIPGPDSMMPQWRDVTDSFKHVGWMLGRNKHPGLDRWAYWEKFDYWAVFWGVAIIGGSGLMLVNPVLSARYVPGWWLNIALALHHDEAFLAMGYIFLIHFTVAHLRRSRFPMDMAIVDGCITTAEVRHERADWGARIVASGAKVACAGDLPLAGRRIAFVVGWAVVLCGWLLALWGLGEVVRHGL